MPDSVLHFQTEHIFKPQMQVVNMITLATWVLVQVLLIVCGHKTMVWFYAYNYLCYPQVPRNNNHTDMQRLKFDKTSHEN